MRTDWRGVIAGFALGLVGAGLLVVFPDPAMGWVVLAVGVGLFAYSASARFLRSTYACLTGLVVTALLLAPMREVSDYADSVRPAPRLEFGGMRWDHHDGYYWPEIQLRSVNGIEINNFSIALASDIKSEPVSYPKVVIDNAFKGMMRIEAPRIANAVAVPEITSGLDQPLEAKISDQQMRLVLNGAARLSIMFVAVYSHEGGKPKHVRVTTFYAYLRPDPLSQNLMNSWIVIPQYTTHFPARPGTFPRLATERLHLT